MRCEERKTDARQHTLRHGETRPGEYLRGVGGERFARVSGAAGRGKVGPFEPLKAIGDGGECIGIEAVELGVVKLIQVKVEA
jgi:hypothetical protein